MNGMSRREFLRQSAIGTAALALSSFSARAQSEEKVKVGVIGTGAQGQNLLRQLLALPTAEVVAVCDVYAVNRIRAVELTQGKAKSYSDYRALLDQKEIEAVVIATPLHLHAPMTIDALQAGKHVFCEKAIAYSIDEARQMAQVAARTGKVLQIGHQRHYNATYEQAYWLIKEGTIGKVTHVRVLWHRNNSWRRAVPDPKLERLINWRLYRDYSHGLLTELASHQLDVVNWFLGALPISVVGYGGIDYWKDGREVHDNVEMIFNYPGGVRVMYTSLTTNAYDGYGEWFFGDKGTLVLTDENKGLLFRERNAEKLEWEDDANSVQVDGRRAVVIEPTPTRQWRDRGQELQAGNQRNAYYAELEHFLKCVRTGETPKCTASDALPALTCVLGALQAIDKGTRYDFRPEQFQI